MPELSLKSDLFKRVAHDSEKHTPAFIHVKVYNATETHGGNERSAKQIALSDLGTLHTTC